MATGIIKESDLKINFDLFQWKILEDELNYLGNVFIKVNDYPPKLVNSIIEIELQKNGGDQQDVTTNATNK